MGVLVGVKSKDKSLKSISATGQVGTEQGSPARGAGTPEKADAQTVFVKGEPASDEDTARAIAQKWGIDFIKLSEAQLSSHIVHLFLWLCFVKRVLGIVWVVVFEALPQFSLV